MITGLLIKNLRFASGQARLRVPLDLTRGSVTALYGPSGSGKTSLLRMIAGLMSPDEGELIVDGQTWFHHPRQIHLPPQDRQVGYVFQDYALFPSMSVEENLKYASRDKASPLINELAHMMELDNLRSQKPHRLSGGQQQRVALARALIQEPKILLLDEPLSALDQDMRSRLQQHLAALKSRFDITIVLVSHDLAEIFHLADHVICLKDGTVETEGPPIAVFSGRQNSGKCQFDAKVLSIQQGTFVNVLTLLVGTNLVKVVQDSSATTDLKPGDSVTLAMKAFGPVVLQGSGTD